MADATVIAVLGAESTGKSTLVLALQQALSTEGRRVVGVGEVLRVARKVAGVVFARLLKG